ELIKDKHEFKEADVPPYLEVVESDDPKNPGTAVRLGLKNVRLPGIDRLEPPDLVRVTHLPGGPGGASSWKGDVQMEDMAGGACVALYWPFDWDTNKAAVVPVGGARDLAFTYGLSQLDIGTGGAGALALSTPDPVPPNSDFLVTAYVYSANKGDRVE